MAHGQAGELERVLGPVDGEQLGDRPLGARPRADVGAHGRPSFTGSSRRRHRAVERERVEGHDDLGGAGRPGRFQHVAARRRSAVAGVARATRWNTTSGRRRRHQLGQLAAPARRGGGSLQLAGAAVGVGPGVGQVGQRAARQVVDDVDGVAFGQQAVDEVEPMKPAPPVTSALTRGSGTRDPVEHGAVGDLLVVADHDVRSSRAPAPTTDARARGWSRRPRRPAPTRHRGAATDVAHRGAAVDPARRRPTTLRPRRRSASTTAPSADRIDGRATRRAVEQVEVGLEVLVGAAGVEPVVVGGHGEQRAVGDHRRERLALDRHPPAGRDAVEHRRLEHVGAGVDQVGRRRRPRGGFSMKASTRPSASVGTTPKADGSSTAVRCSVPSAPRSRWKAHERADVEVGEHVAVDDHEGRRRCRPSTAAKRMAPAVSSGSGSTA